MLKRDIDLDLPRTRAWFRYHLVGANGAVAAPDGLSGAARGDWMCDSALNLFVREDLNWRPYHFITMSEREDPASPDFAGSAGWIRRAASAVGGCRIRWGFLNSRIATLCFSCGLLVPNVTPQFFLDVNVVPHDSWDRPFFKPSWLHEAGLNGKLGPTSYICINQSSNHSLFSVCNIFLRTVGNICFSELSSRNNFLKRSRIKLFYL